MKQRIKVELFFLLLLVNSVSFSQKKQENPSVLSIKYHQASLLIHSDTLSPFTGCHPWGWELSATKHYLSENAWKNWNCYPRLGFSFYYWNFNHHALGEAFSLMFYVEPHFDITPKTYFSFRGGFGVAYLSQPFDEVTNPLNVAYSTNLSFPLLLGASLNYHFNESWQGILSVNYNHISNGGISHPNYGLNYPSILIGMDYIVNPLPLPERVKIPFKEFPDKVNHWEISSFFALKDEEIGPRRRQPLVGLNVNYRKQIARINCLTVGMDIVWDYGVKYSLEQKNLEKKDFKRISLIAGHEFLLGRFVFSQLLGVYLYRPFIYSDPVFQRYALRFYATPAFFVGASLKAHGQNAEYPALLMGWKFN